MTDIYIVGRSKAMIACRSLLIHLQAGAIAAFTVDVLVYPLDTIKTRIQSQDYIKTYSESSRKNIWAVRGLYQGIGSVVLATLPAGMSRPK